MKKTDLVKVSTYANKCGVSVQAVYKWAKSGKIKTAEIDGVLFIVEDKNDGNISSETA